ncbi:hypothetical protein [Desulfurella sp.]|uniref:hypothetical protein n=1 Tax=Desulfurella sp. TaxID=1962857 RepID=UPI0025BD9E3D|nr:hypothetical protein [Desulfurella sp.]
MKMCEYMNNIISLDMLSKQGLRGKIDYVNFYKNVFDEPNDNYIILFNGINYIFFRLRVEKAFEDRILPLVLDFSSLYYYGLNMTRRTLPASVVKLMFGGDWE